eukprot:3916662-Lingulodinium_polyedra.AAC.1
MLGGRNHAAPSTPGMRACKARSERRMVPRPTSGSSRRTVSRNSPQKRQRGSFQMSWTTARGKTAGCSSP